MKKLLLFSFGETVNKHSLVEMGRFDTFLSELQRLSKETQRDVGKIDRTENRLFEIYYICNTCFSTEEMP